ncbi:MAG: MFS transporter [SAR324 cluster bacterium]|nr:MFS transporter [SAR324 cluster bacterium]
MQEITQETISDVAIYAGYMMFTFSFAQFIFSPILGSLSDHYGRRPILILSLLGLGIDYIILTFANSLSWLFLGRILTGIMGASYTTALAYIADISTLKTRPKNFGLVQAATGLGFMIGPFIGGVLGDINSRLPFIVAAILAISNAIYGVFFLPESLAFNKRSRFTLKGINPFSNILYFTKNPKLTLVMVAYFLFHMGESVFPSIWPFFTIEKFNWSLTMIGYSLGFFGFSLIVIQSLLAEPVIKLLGKRTTILVGITITVIGYSACGVTDRGWHMFPISLLFELGWLSMTAFLSLAVAMVPDNEQGKFQGALASLISATNILGPLAMTQIFSYFTQDDKFYYFPGAPFLFAGLLALLSLPICYYWTKPK